MPCKIACVLNPKLTALATAVYTPCGKEDRGSDRGRRDAWRREVICTRSSRQLAKRSRWHLTRLNHASSGQWHRTVCCVCWADRRLANGKQRCGQDGDGRTKLHNWAGPEPAATLIAWQPRESRTKQGCCCQPQRQQQSCTTASGPERIAGCASGRRATARVRRAGQAQPGRDSVPLSAGK